MPANLFSELDNLTSSHLENDNRAMAIALELTMLRLNDPDISPTNSLPESLSLSQPESPLGLASPHLTSFLQDSAEDLRNKKSANMTECVPVPSSEHVAEIVGRQGCKIKALRAKTNTYIKTPVRHEEPVFVVTGRKEDVCRAKREILSAADHFSALRASRKSGALSPLSPPTGVPGHVTIEVRVPYKVVGLVVGPKGATIKRIQHQTNTYIVTPSRDKEPVFEVTGAPDSVEIARAEIESHIIRRTGSCITPPACADPLLGGGSMPCPPCGGGSDDGGALPSSADLLLASLCNSGLGSLGTILNYVGQQGVGHGGVGHGGMGHGGMGQGGGYEGDHQFTNGFTPLGMMGMNGLGSASQGNHHMFSSSSGCSSASSSSSSTSAPNTSSGLDLTSIWSGMSSLDKDEGLGDSSPSFSGGDSTPSPVGTQPPSSSSIWSYPPLSSASPSGSVSGGSSSRACYVCADRDVTHALVPCGHNLFCSECADRTVDFDRLCPVCRSPVHQAMRIIS